MDYGEKILKEVVREFESMTTKEYNKLYSQLNGRTTLFMRFRLRLTQTLEKLKLFLSRFA